MIHQQLVQPYQGGFEGSEHLFALRIYFEDTDLGGIVYHANYLRFMERARSDMLRAIGIDQRAAVEAGEGVYAISDLSIRYRRPARLDDALLVRSRVVEIRAAATIIEQIIERTSGDTVEILTEARVTAVLLTPQGRPKRQPQAWVEAFSKLRERA